MQEVELILQYSSGSIAKAIAGALSPETALAEVPKARADVTLQGERLQIAIAADDLGALRAGINSYLRWADAAERAAKTGSAGRE